MDFLFTPQWIILYFSLELEESNVLGWICMRGKEVTHRQKQTYL